MATINVAASIFVKSGLHCTEMVILGAGIRIVINLFLSFLNDDG
jgi:hypothetical protein